MVEALLAQKEMSTFFQDMDSYSSIQSRIKDEIGYINKDKADEEKEKDSLGEKRDEEYDSKYVIEQEKSVVEKAEAELVQAAEKTKIPLAESKLSYEKYNAAQVDLAKMSNDPKGKDPSTLSKLAFTSTELLNGPLTKDKLDQLKALQAEIKAIKERSDSK